MIKKIIGFFTVNITWKALSVLTAVMLWFLVMNIYNPVKISNINAALQLENLHTIEKNNYILVNEASLNSRLIVLRISASAKAWDDLKQRQKDVKAYIDMGPIDISQTVELDKPMSVTVKVDLPSGLNPADYEIKTITPSTVDIILDKYVSQEFPVRVQKIGDDKEGYVTLTPQAIPESVIIKGAQKNVNLIDRVQVSADVSSSTTDIESSGVIQVLDADGNDITSLLDLETDKVQIVIPVEKYSRIAINAPRISGMPADGSMFISAQWTPEYVEVVGSEEDINALQPIELPETSVDNRNESFEKTYDLRQYFIDTNVSIKNGTPNEVKLTINIGEEAVKEVAIPIETLTIQGMSQPSIVLPQGDVKIKLRGTKDAIDALTDESTNGVIDLTGLDLGKHSVSVEFPNLPDNVMIISEAPVIEVELEGATATPPPAEGEDTGGLTDADEQEETFASEIG